jgi:hypothetical protein
MPTDATLYLKVNPGDLITADLFNTVQEDVKKDIAQQIQTSIGGITTVKHADDAGTVDGLNVDQLTNQILEKVKAMIPGRTGYMRTFNRLKVHQPTVIKHNLGAEPVVDVYQLEYFQVVCAQGETATDAIVEYVNFFLYHESEKVIRGNETVTTTGANGVSTTSTSVVSVTIEDQRIPQYRIPFKDMLSEFNVDTSKDGTTIDELVTSFWTALFGSPNDTFDPAQYCHSFWFEKCCGELRTIKDLKDRGDWDHIWFKMLPRKTINYPATDPSTVAISNVNLGAAGPVVKTPQQRQLSAFDYPAPTQVEVVQLDYNTVALALIADPILQPNVPDALKTELVVMTIMKA